MADKEKNEKVESIEMVEVKLTKNIKYGETPYSKGETIEIKKSDYEEFKAAKVIEIEEDEDTEE